MRFKFESPIIKIPSFVFVMSQSAFLCMVVLCKIMSNALKYGCYGPGSGVSRLTAGG